MAWLEKVSLKKGISYYVRYAENGKNFTYGKYPSKALAEKARLKCETELSEKTTSEIITIRKLWALYKERKLEVRESTLERYENIINDFVKNIGDVNIRDVTVSIVFDYLHLKKNTLKTATINKILVLLRTIFRYACQWDIIGKNPFDKVDNLKVTDKKETPVLTREIIESVYNVLDSDDRWFSDVFITALYSGMRIGEIINLSWNNVDLEKNIISIQISKTAPRVIPIHPAVKKILIELQHRHKEFQFADDYIFRSIHGKPFVSYTKPRSSILQKLVQVMCEIGHPEITQFHSTRHTFVTHFLKYSSSKEITGFISGHKSKAIDTYIHDVHAEKKQELMRDFEY